MQLLLGDTQVNVLDVHVGLGVSEVILLNVAADGGSLNHGIVKLLGAALSLIKSIEGKETIAVLTLGDFVGSNVSVQNVEAKALHVFEEI